MQGEGMVYHGWGLEEGEADDRRDAVKHRDADCNSRR
jgi:hypothetical protein